MQEEYFKCFNVEEEIRVLFLFLFLFLSVFGFFCTRIKTWLDRTHPILTQSKEAGWCRDRVWDLDSGRT